MTIFERQINRVTRRAIKKAIADNLIPLDKVDAVKAFVADDDDCCLVGCEMYTRFRPDIDNDLFGAVGDGKILEFLKWLIESGNLDKLIQLILSLF